MISSAQYVEGNQVVFEGTHMTIVEVQALPHRKGTKRSTPHRGFRSCLATEDGGRVERHGVCACENPGPRVKAANLVIEDDFFICATCRRGVQRSAVPENLF